MANKPTTFSSRTKTITSRNGGSAHLRDRSAAFRRVCERLLTVDPLCRYCRSQGRITAATVTDHIIALALGGTNDTSNLAPACRDCNDRKSTDEKRFIAKRYDLVDVMRDRALAVWIAHAAFRLPETD
ncbi:HNH endonuclease [Sphingomonas sp. Leaf242]|uniref:HNH endonuclease n=1 Tax=Sphingomonas sp. Leaf242 TaxID=1736304 RepID=UPI000715F9D2|nr:HNH endonuclease signature motif containing protein [Sphingomonas sp. Leaf242]KQO06916.1 hypothetical protein ASF09_11690 [Sphingomonas sp. Leaf242]